MQRSKRQAAGLGFTIIEVLIVLAIAGLILLIIFLAVPQMQRVRRDYGRKRQADVVAAGMREDNTNNAHLPYDGAGSNPNERCAFIQAVIAKGTVTCSTAGNPRNCVLSTVAQYRYCFISSVTGHHNYMGEYDEIDIILSHWCNAYGDGDAPGDAVASATTDNNYKIFSVYAKLEGSATVYCVDNRGKAT